MANPVFVHIMANGDVWASIDVGFVPSGTTAAVYKLNSSLATQKVGTISGNAGSYTGSNSIGTNRHGGKENT